MTTAGPLADFLSAVAARPLAGLTDGQLLGRYVRERDEASFAELVRRHAGMVHAVARRAGLNHADADDCTQAAFVVLARHADRLTGDATVGDWLHGVAVRVALTARTRTRRRHKYEHRAARPDHAPPDPSAERLDTAAAVDRAVRALPAKLRDAVVLCDLEGVPRPEAAARLGVPVGTLSSRLTAAHAKLARRLARPLGFAALTLAAGQPPAALARAALAAAFAHPRAVPSGVSVLVHGVMRMVWLTKLKLLAAGGAAALTIGAATVAGGRYAAAEEPKNPAALPEYAPKYGVVVRSAAPDPPTAQPERKAPAAGGPVADRRYEAELAERERLAGTWQIWSETLDGKPLGPTEHPATRRMTFDREGRHVLYESFRTDGTLSEHLTSFHYLVNPHRSPKELFITGTNQSMVYELDGDTLRFARFSVYGLDRPRGFAVADQPPDSPPGRNSPAPSEAGREVTGRAECGHLSSICASDANGFPST